MVSCMWALQTEDKFVSNRFGNTHREERITAERTGERLICSETENRFDNVTLWTLSNTEKKKKTENKGIGNQLIVG